MSGLTQGRCRAGRYAGHALRDLERAYVRNTLARMDDHGLTREHPGESSNLICVSLNSVAREFGDRPDTIGLGGRAHV